MKTANVLVTGANGFVGSALLEGLLEEAQFSKLFAMHRSDLTDEIKQRFDLPVQWFKADITTDDITHIVANVDVVFHLAAYFSSSESNAECDLLKQINVLGTQRLAAACKRGGVRHLIYVSSIAACEAGQSVLINESNGFPISAYGKSKQSAEDLLLKMSEDSFQVTIVRPTVLFGENHLGSIYELVKVINNRRFILFGNGKNHTNFYYIRDFIHVLLALKNDIKSYGQVFIAADKPYQLNELVFFILRGLKKKQTIYKIPFFMGYILSIFCDIAGKLLGKTMPISKKRYRAMVRDIIYSNSKLSQVLDVRPKYGLSEGMINTIKWYREAGLL